MKTTMSSKGQIVLPANYRRKDGLHPGQEFEIERLASGVYRLAKGRKHPNDGLLKRLLACPVKGFFVRVKSETTDTLFEKKLF